MKRVVVLVCVVTLCYLALASPAGAAAPRYIMVSGPRLARPALIDDWNETFAFIVAVAQSSRTKASLAHRPRYLLSLFWQGTDEPVPTDPKEGNQFGWFYPAHGTRRAVVDLFVSGSRYPRRAPPRVLAILANHGVPTRL